MPSGRGRTCPLMATTYSERMAWARSWASGLLLGAEDHLGQAFAVAQVDEDQAAVVAPELDPSP